MKYYPQLRTLCGCRRDMLDYEITLPWRSEMLMPVPNSNIRSCWIRPEPVEVVDSPCFNARKFVFQGQTELRSRRKLDGSLEVITFVVYEELPEQLNGNPAAVLRAIGNRNGQPVPKYIDKEYQIEDYERRESDIHDLVVDRKEAVVVKDAREAARVKLIRQVAKSADKQGI